MKKYNQVRRVGQSNEENTPFLLSIWQFFAGIFLWIFFIVATGITIYAHWFSQSLIYIFQLFKTKNYIIPMWFSAVFSIFLFPLSLTIILVSTLIKIVRGN